jgi:predicted MFS family arabinose efflux permease
VALLISSIGDPLTLTVALVLLYTETRMAAAVGAAYACRMVAAIVVGGFGGTITDRLDRRRLMIGLDVLRLVLVATMPFTTRGSPLIIYAYLLVLGGCEALVQPARLAAITTVVPERHIESANSVVVTAFSIAQAAGFALAGVVLATLADARLAFYGDALTFGLSALLVLTLPNLGGGIHTFRLRGGALGLLQRPSLRPLLLVAGGANLLIGMGTPVILPVAYQLWRSGAVAYTWLEVALIAGLVLGSLVAPRIPVSRTLQGLAAALVLFALAAFGVGFTPILAGAVFAILWTGVGNAVYAVTNRSALMRRAEPREQGSVMAARYTLGQAAQIIGLGAGALCATLIGAQPTFVATGAGLLVVALAFMTYVAREARSAADP